MRPRRWGTGLAAAVVLSAPGCTGGAVDADTRAEVLGTVERFFEAMRTRDTAALRALSAPDLMLVAAADSAGVTRIRRLPVGDLLDAVARTPDELRERIWSAEVRLDGPIATVWAPYDFHVGDQLSHCGTDAFHLVRTGAGWTFTAMLYTTWPPPCPGPRAMEAP